MTSSIGRILLPAFAVLSVSFLATGANAAPQAPSVTLGSNPVISIGYRSRSHGGYGYRGGYGYSRRSYGYARRYRGRSGYGGYGHGSYGNRHGYGGASAYVARRLFRSFGVYGGGHGGYRSYRNRSYGYGRNRGHGGYGYGYGGSNYR